MEKRVAVLYNRELVQYDIQEKKNGCFIARLYRYNGNRGEAPPQQIDLCKEGRHWKDDDADPDLVDDIGNAIEFEKRVPNEQPIYYQRGTEEDRRNRGNGGESRP